MILRMHAVRAAAAPAAVRLAVAQLLVLLRVELTGYGAPDGPPTAEEIHAHARSAMGFDAVRDGILHTHATCAWNRGTNRIEPILAFSCFMSSQDIWLHANGYDWFMFSLWRTFV